jgi:hypothetical protein
MLRAGLTFGFLMSNVCASARGRPCHFKADAAAEAGDISADESYDEATALI